MSSRLPGLRIGRCSTALIDVSYSLLRKAVKADEAVSNSTRACHHSYSMRASSSPSQSSYSGIRDNGIREMAALLNSRHCACRNLADQGRASTRQERTKVRKNELHTAKRAPRTAKPERNIVIQASSIQHPAYDHSGWNEVPEIEGRLT